MPKPSGADLATWVAPIMALAPGLFSTTTGTFTSSVMACPIARAS